MRFRQNLSPTVALTQYKRIVRQCLTSYTKQRMYIYFMINVYLTENLLCLGKGNNVDKKGDVEQTRYCNDMLYCLCFFLRIFQQLHHRCLNT